MTVRGTIFTIGHSTHSQERFISLLREHRITALCDVRSTPYSRVNPQFNREILEQDLLPFGITYRFLGQELGARSDNPNCHTNGKVQYDRLAETELFRYGIKRVVSGMKEHRVALMCAEKEPLACHRAILVARYLAALGIDVEHIHADGHFETQADAMKRLTRMLRLPPVDDRSSHSDPVFDLQIPDAAELPRIMGHHDPVVS
jgi:uncharacterized protein (DUF488 family)